MLGVIWGIIKVILIIIACILGLLILIVLSLLFVPLRYDLNIAANGDIGSVKFHGTVSWLLHFIHVVVTFADKTLGYRIRILGIRLKKLEKDSGSKESSKKKAADEEEELEEYEKIFAADNNDKSEEVLAVAEDGKSKDEELSIFKEEKTELLPDNGNKELSLENKEEPFEKKKKEKKKKPKKEKKKKEKKAKKKKDKSLKKESKFANIKKKLKKLRDFLKDEQNKAAFAVVKKEAGRMLKSVLPKKFKGDVTFGFEDPSTTGYILAGLAAFYPAYYKTLKVTPDFDGQIIKGNIWIKGRIFGYVFVFSGLRLLLNKDIKRLIKQFKSKEE